MPFLFEDLFYRPVTRLRICCIFGEPRLFEKCGKCLQDSDMMFLRDKQRTDLVIMVSLEESSNDYRRRIGGRHVEFRVDENELAV